MNAEKVRKLAVGILVALAVAGLIAWLVFSARKGKADEESGKGQLVEDVMPVQENTTLENVDESPASGVDKKPEDIKPKEDDKKEVDVSSLSNSPQWADFAGGDYARNAVVFMDEVSMGYVPVRSLGSIRSEEPFTAEQQGTAWVLSEKTEQRYSAFIDMLCGIDSSLAARLFVKSAPVMQTLIEALGYSDRTPYSMLGDVAVMIRQIPDCKGNPLMEKRDDSTYVWQDSNLEQLQPVQKLLLRLGYGNLQKIRAKVESFTEAVKAEQNGK